MLRIAICDDELHARESLTFELEKILDEVSEKVVYEFSSGEAAASWIGKHPGEIDLLFLDIELKNKNGLNTAKEIRQKDQDLFIVFVTGYRDYVFDGYQVNALDYILKPADANRLCSLINRVRRMLSERDKEFFVFHNTEGTYRFSVKMIDYFYSDKRLVYAVIKGQDYPFYDKLDEVAKRLGGTFVRIHQRFLVNPANVNFIDSKCVYIHNKELPMSRALKEEATRQLARFIMGGGNDGNSI